jgi:hypothetical protein
MPEEGSDQVRPEAQAQADAQGATLRVHGRDVKTSYANICLLFSTREEVFLEFGLALPSAGENQQEANMLVSDRVIMSPVAAKRLAIALSQALQQYENAFGVIPIEPAQAQPSRQAPSA